MLMEIAKAGSTTLALTAQSNTAPYQLKTNGWTMGVPGRSRSLLRDIPFTDAAEELVIHIFGTTYAECLTNYTTLITRLNDAADFTDGRQSVPVLWRVQPLGATEILTAVILGPVGDTPMVNAAPNILEFEDGFWIRDVPVSFMRRPLLVSTVEASSSQAAATNIGTVQTVSFAAAATTPSPTKLYVGTNASSLVHDSAYGFAILTESNTAGVGANLRTIAASTLSGATDYSTLADAAANRAVSASILRFTPTATTRRVTNNPGLSVPFQQALMLAEVRNNLLGKEYVIDVELQTGDRWVRGRSEVIDGLSVAARYVVLGVVTTPGTITGIRLGIQAAVPPAAPWTWTGCSSWRRPRPSLSSMARSLRRSTWPGCLPTTAISRRRRRPRKSRTWAATSSASSGRWMPTRCCSPSPRSCKRSGSRSPAPPPGRCRSASAAATPCAPRPSAIRHP
jgi:hypothetical protein